MGDLNIWSGWIQLGFAGFAFALLGVLVWMVKNVFKSNAETNRVVSANTEVIKLVSVGIKDTKDTVSEKVDEIKTLQIEIKDRVLSNPCLLPDEVKDKIKPMVRELMAGKG